MRKTGRSDAGPGVKERGWPLAAGEAEDPRPELSEGMKSHKRLDLCPVRPILDIRPPPKDSKFVFVLSH